MRSGSGCDRLIVAALLLALAAGCARPTGEASPDSEAETEQASNSAAVRSTTGAESADVPESTGETAQLVLAGGCFWCMEAAFEQLRGVHDVVSGYAGGTAETADYQTVGAGLTKHAEAIRITYDPAVISDETLLRVFFTAAHDPTQINRQYPDIGRQYRSAVFFADDEQKQTARAMIDKLNQSGQFGKPIATTLEPLDGFYVAEDYHQDYVRHHPRDRYVVAHSIPRAEKVRELFPELIREP